MKLTMQYVKLSEKMMPSTMRRRKKRITAAYHIFAGVPHVFTPFNAFFHGIFTVYAEWPRDAERQIFRLGFFFLVNYV